MTYTISVRQLSHQLLWLVHILTDKRRFYTAPQNMIKLTLLKLPLHRQHGRSHLPTLRPRPHIQHIRIKHPFIRFRQRMTRHRYFVPKFHHLFRLRGRFECLHPFIDTRRVPQTVSAGEGSVWPEMARTGPSVFGLFEQLSGVGIGCNGVGGDGECGRGGVGGYEGAAVRVP